MYGHVCVRMRMCVGVRVSDANSRAVCSAVHVWGAWCRGCVRMTWIHHCGWQSTVIIDLYHGWPPSRNLGYAVWGRLDKSGNMLVPRPGNNMADLDQRTRPMGLDLGDL